MRCGEYVGQCHQSQALTCGFHLRPKPAMGSRCARSAVARPGDSTAEGRAGLGRGCQPRLSASRAAVTTCRRSASGLATTEQEPGLAVDVGEADPGAAQSRVDGGRVAAVWPPVHDPVTGRSHSSRSGEEAIRSASRSARAVSASIRPATVLKRYAKAIPSRYVNLVPLRRLALRHVQDQADRRRPLLGRRRSELPALLASRRAGHRIRLVERPSRGGPRLGLRMDP